MIARPTLNRRTHKGGLFIGTDDLDYRLNKIVQKSTAAVEQKAKEILRQRSKDELKLSANA